MGRVNALGAELARLTREVIEAHSEWDSPHQFVTFAVEGDAVRPRLLAVIDPAIDPRDYPETMFSLGSKDMARNGPACGFLLQIESYAVKQLPDSASAAEREQLERDRRGRTFHQRPDAREMCGAWTVAPDGRGWAASKYRDEPGIHEESWRPGDAPGGQMVRALLALARCSQILEEAGGTS